MQRDEKKIAEEGLFAYARTRSSPGSHWFLRDKEGLFKILIAEQLFPYTESIVLLRKMDHFFRLKSIDPLFKYGNYILFLLFSEMRYNVFPKIFTSNNRLINDLYVIERKISYFLVGCNKYSQFDCNLYASRLPIAMYFDMKEYTKISNVRCFL